MQKGATVPMLLTPTEAARLLACHSNSVRRWIHEEKLPAVRLPGGGLRIPSDAVERVLRPVTPDDAPKESATHG